MKFGFRILASQIAATQNCHTKSFSSPATYLDKKSQFERIIVLLSHIPSNLSRSGNIQATRMDIIEELLSEQSIQIIDEFLQENKASDCYSSYLKCLLSG